MRRRHYAILEKGGLEMRSTFLCLTLAMACVLFGQPAAGEFPVQLKTYLHLTPRQQGNILKLNREFDQTAAEERKKAEEHGQSADVAAKIRRDLVETRNRIIAALNTEQRLALAALEQRDAPKELAGLARQMRMIEGSTDPGTGHFKGPTTKDRSYTIPPAK